MVALKKQKLSSKPGQVFVVLCPYIYILYIPMLLCSLHQILIPSSECRSRNRDSSDQATFFQSSIVQFWWSCVNCILRVLSWQEQHPVWSSAAGAHLLQGSMCCVFRDGILHTLVVTSGYLSYCFLSIISNQSVHSPLTSAAHGIFSLFLTILCKQHLHLYLHLCI